MLASLAQRITETSLNDIRDQLFEASEYLMELTMNEAIIDDASSSRDSRITGCFDYDDRISALVVLSDMNSFMDAYLAMDPELLALTEDSLRRWLDEPPSNCLYPPETEPVNPADLMMANPEQAYAFNMDNVVEDSTARGARGSFERPAAPDRARFRSLAWVSQVEHAWGLAATPVKFDIIRTRTSPFQVSKEYEDEEQALRRWKAYSNVSLLKGFPLVENGVFATIKNNCDINGDCYWRSLSFALHGVPTRWNMIKATHLVHVHRVLSDESHPRYELDSKVNA
ncbi:hypothetical protein F4777DRAFT_577503 [Nemania sp. FL0916]|nr:hypothetical protein F4777DRAFT_577503 [Nemania sp. FL0916]